MNEGGTENGPWRDGWYVVASAATEMPKRCMVCGAMVDELKTTPVPLPRGARRLVGGAIWLLAGERFQVRHGRCARHGVPWGMYAGIVAGVVCVATMVVLVGTMLIGNGRFGLVQGVLVGGFVVSFFAAIGLAMKSLRIEKTDGVHVWIGGFGRGFRARLSEFRNRR